ncbi:hypothetical protein Tco_1400165 [Tanacetum coccineum]
MSSETMNLNCVNLDKAIPENSKVMGENKVYFLCDYSNTTLNRRRASNSELVEPLLEPERTLNRRRRRRNRRLSENFYPNGDNEPLGLLAMVSPTTPGSAITIPETANEFAIKGNQLTLVKGNQFDGRTKTDPHKHIHEFLKICDMFKYRDTENEVVRLMMFPLSLTGEAKTWMDELNEGTIETWDEL